MERKVIGDTILCLIKEELEISTSQKVELTSKLLSIGIDSIAMMTLLVFIEEKFNFAVDEDVLISNRFVTVNEIVDYVEEKTNKNIA